MAMIKNNRNQIIFMKNVVSKSFKKVRLKTKPLQSRHSPSSSSSSFSTPTSSYNRKFNILIVCFLCICVPSVLGNRPPRFLIEGHSEIVLRLKEGPDTPINKSIYRLKGYDADGDQLEFGIRNSYESDILRIENVGTNEANLYLTKELDRETKDEYSLVLTLTDHRLGEGNFITQSLLLLVEDINDNEPIFKPFQSALEVPENSRPGILTTVEATDRDEGAYGQVVYYLQELDGDNDVFTINTIQGKGVIKLVKELDYEKKSLYQLRVLAVDRAHQGKVNTATAALLVKIRDIEDQPPEFIAVTPVARVPEDASLGTQVLKVKAIDGDRGVNNRIKYSIVRGGNNLFDIDPETGSIIVVKKLDREDPSNQVNGAYILEISATEISKIRPPPSVQTEVTIILTDVNDETPTFRATRYHCAINENAQTNTPVTFLGNARNEVFDYDQGNNGTFELLLHPPNDIFEITPSRGVNEATFLIRVKNSEKLDYENIASLNFTIFAREIVSHGKSSSVPVHIAILDRNDNYPEFSEPMYEVFVPENVGVGATIAHVKARDLDSGNYGTHGIRYSGLSGSVAHLLNLNPMSGVITVKSEVGQAFDRELIAHHYLTVEARDDLGKGNRNTVQLIVNIEDVNDNPPIFVQKKYEVRLLENKMTFETPLIVEAKDVDLNGTQNSRITYEMVDGELRDNFTINSQTGEISPHGPMDFEAVSGGFDNIRTLHLTVQARDSGDPSLATKVPVIVYLQDVNDHVPQFQHALYKKAIPEDLPGGSSILEVKAYDGDGSSPNNLVVYRIIKGASDKFVISSDTGIISVAQGSKLDPDLTDPKTTEYTLSVVALDGGLGDDQQSSITMVNITIVDINNKPPIFDEPGTIYVKENTPVGTSIYRILANDFDERPVLRYQFDANISEARSEEGVIIKPSEYDYLGAFDLNAADGLIRVVKLIDREKVEQIKLGVVVEDVAAARGRQIVHSTLMVIVEDENDNNPRFRKPFYKRSITENSPNGVTIANILAFDVDKNRTITYSLEGSSELKDLVHLDSESGEIVVANRIDHETFDWLNLTVRAIDNGIPTRSSLVDVFIQVIDENDNNPYFVGEKTNFTISENSPIGTRIGMIEARDADSGDFGKITFMIDKISSHGKFMIDADTGVLSVADTLDREDKDSYMLVIEAWDNYQFGYLSGESRNAFKQIFVTISDENDNPPELIAPKGCIQITEYHELREIVIKLKAKDADDPQTPNGKVIFEARSGSAVELFRIDQIDDLTAYIMPQRSLKGFYGNYTLDIVLSDLGEPANVIDQKLDICVSDFNDHAPIFISPTHNVTIRVAENATIGTPIIQVTAEDEDEGPNALVRYRLKPDPVGNYRSFNIDQDSGLITLKMPLDRERQKLYEIRVEAYDQGIPTPLSTDLDLIVYVRNVNDYEPQFLVEEIVVNFTEHSSPGEERIKLPDTVDRDEVDELDDPPSIVCYYIVFGNENDTFQLEPETHVLSLKKELDREIQANHSLIIKATEDCLNPPQKLKIYKPEALISSTISKEKPFSVRYKQSTSNKYVDHFDRFKHSRSLRSLEDEDVHQYSNFDELAVTVEVPDDNTLVKIFVNVQDINDNPPLFERKIFTGGVTTSTDFGTQFMSVRATDRDEGLNSKIAYYQIGDIHRTLTEGLDNIEKLPFLVDRNSGAIQLNFDPQKGMKGYFDFMVLANDTDGLQDVCHVFIYLLREDQRVRFVLRQQPPELRANIHAFREILGNVTNAIVNVDEFKVHENKDGSVDKTKTDVYLHLVDKNDNSILEVAEVLKLIDLNIEQLDSLFKDFNVIDTQPAEPQPLIGAFGQSGPMVVSLVVSNIFIGALLVVVIGLCVSQRANYRRQLRVARVNSYATTTSNLTPRATRVPNTNKHSIEGSNPIWLKAYANEWFKNDDDVISTGSGGGGGGPDSLDENVLTHDEYHHIKQQKGINGLDTQNNLSMPYNLYQQIEKQTHILQKKLETTEL